MSGQWSRLAPTALPGWHFEPPLEEAVVAGDGHAPWLIGGVIPAEPASTGEFRTFPHPTVAIWAASSPTGPWKLASMRADPQRDGPNETIQFLASGRTPALAFGWRNSPTEGYPRPSAWIAADGTGRQWSEVIEDREFFGGPSVVGFAGASSGPHGDFVAGTWTGVSDAPVASVWSSRDGRNWSRDATDPALVGQPGQLPFATGIADGPRGVLLTGTLDIPTRRDPTRQQGVLWYSPDGTSWARRDSSALNGAADSTLGAVAATADGWVVGGTETLARKTRPLAWFVPAGRSPAKPVLLADPSDAGQTTVTGLAVDDSRAVMAAIVRGRARLWIAPLHQGVPGAWTELQAPPSALGSLQRVDVSISPAGAVVALVARSSTEIWTLEEHPG